MMEINPLTIAAMVGVASLLIERIFYYRSLYRRKNSNPGNYGERMGKIETRLEDIEDDLKRIKDKLDLI